MNFTATKTPLLIAAMATAVALTSFGPTNAATIGNTASFESVQNFDGNFEVVDAKFKFKKFSKGKKFGGSSFKKKKLVTGHSFGKKKKFQPKQSFAKKKLLKKLF